MSGLPPLYGVSSVDKTRLEEVGVKDLRALAELPNPDEIARLTDVEPERLEIWRQEAKHELSARRTRIVLVLVIASVIVAAVLVQRMASSPRKRPEDYHSSDLQASLDEQVQRHLATLRNRPDDQAAKAALDEILSHSLAAARHLRDEKEWDEALRIYARVLQIDPANAESRFYCGWILLQQKHYDDAIRVFSQSLPGSPEYRDWTYLNLGIAQVNGGHEAKAEEALKLASPAFVPALLQRTIIAQSNGRHEEATALYKRILETDPRNQAALYGLYDLTGDLDYRHRLERLGGRYADWLKAEDEIRTGNYKAAVAVYEKLLAAAPDDVETARILGETYVGWGGATSDVETARKGITRLQNLVARGDAPPEARFSLAWAYQVAPGRAQNLDAAMNYYQEYLDSVPSNHTAWNNMAYILLAKDDREGFLNFAQKSVRAMPHDARAHLNLGYGLYLKGDLEGALKECRLSMEIDKEFSGSPLRCGEFSLWHGDLQQAFDYFEEARKLARKEGETGVIWAMLLMRSFGGETTERLVYYGTQARKQAGLDLLESMVRLAENRGKEARDRAHEALARLTGAPEDVAIVRRALNDLSRFEAHKPLTKDGLALRTTLETWKKEKENSSR